MLAVGLHHPGIVVEEDKEDLGWPPGSASTARQRTPAYQGPAAAAATGRGSSSAPKSEMGKLSFGMPFTGFS